MGIINKVISATPLGTIYKRLNQQKVDKAQQLLEAKLLPERITFYRQFISASDLVFDVGANVGNRVEAFLACGATVIAVEPQPNCVATLNKKFGNKITIENVGLGDTFGELQMQISSDSTVSSFNEDYINKTKDRFKYSKWEDTIQVKIKTLDSLIQHYGVPQFCKIDVEGFELQVLKGLHQSIPYISFEYCVPEMLDQAQDCIAYLHHLSPTSTFNYSIEETMKWALPNWMAYDEFKEHILSPTFAHTLFGDIYIKSI